MQGVAWASAHAIRTNKKHRQLPLSVFLYSNNRRVRVGSRPRYGLLLPLGVPFALSCFWPSCLLSVLPLIVSPSSLPLYLVTNLLPSRSRVTVNEIVSSLNYASPIAVSWLLRPTIEPVSLSPSSLSFRVCSRV